LEWGVSLGLGWTLKGPMALWNGACLCVSFGYAEATGLRDPNGAYGPVEWGVSFG